MPTLTAIQEIHISEDYFTEIKHEFYCEPCPFCGSECVEFVAVDLSPFHDWRRVACVDCDAMGPSGETYQDAVNSWNKASR